MFKTLMKFVVTLTFGLQAIAQAQMPTPQQIERMASLKFGNLGELAKYAAERSGDKEIARSILDAAAAEGLDEKSRVPEMKIGENALLIEGLTEPIYYNKSIPAISYKNRVVVLNENETVRSLVIKLKNSWGGLPEFAMSNKKTKSSLQSMLLSLLLPEAHAFFVELVVVGAAAALIVGFFIVVGGSFVGTAVTKTIRKSHYKYRLTPYTLDCGDFKKGVTTFLKFGKADLKKGYDTISIDRRMKKNEQNTSEERFHLFLQIDDENETKIWRDYVISNQDGVLRPKNTPNRIMPDVKLEPSEESLLQALVMQVRNVCTANDVATEQRKFNKKLSDFHKKVLDGFDPAVGPIPYLPAVE